MRNMALNAFVATVLLAVLSVSPAAAQDLGQIAPGLTANTLCPLVKSNPQAAISAIASGAARAYDQGFKAQTNFAQAMAAAVMAANTNGCINELFEGVNQAIIKGGSKVEYITGKAIAIGVAQGTASDGGQVLAKATAVVICRGGASAAACARAWNQAIKFDPNGCAVLVQAFVQAKAQCAGGKALTSVKAEVWKTPLGFCRVPTVLFGDSNNGAYNYKGSAAGSYYGGQGAVVLSQGPGVTSSSVFVTNGGVSSGQKVFSKADFDGRKMLAMQDGPSADLQAKVSQSLLRRLLGATNWPFGNTANSQATAVNNGIANGGVFANSGANAQGYGWGPTTANSQATAVNNGIANGPVVANSFANAGRKLKNVDNWPFGNTANSQATAVNNGIANGGVFANSGANAQGYGWGPTTANSQATAVNNGIANGPVVANSFANAGRKLKNVDNWPFGNTANSQATAVNNGIANGGVFANSGANAQGYGWGPTTANSQATAVNNGIANGPVVANSFANADGGRKLQTVDN